MKSDLQTRINRIKIEIEAISEWPDGMHDKLAKSLLVAIEGLEYCTTHAAAFTADYVTMKLEEIASTWEGQ